MIFHAEKCYISNIAPSGAIESIVNETLHFLPLLSCDALRLLVFFSVFPTQGLAAGKKNSSNKRESQSTLATGKMIDIRLPCTVELCTPAQSAGTSK